MIKLNVSAANIAVEEKETLTEGRVGLLCRFSFTGEWDGLAKTAVFDGADSRDVILTEDTVAVPAECLAAEGYSLSVGVYGKNAAGDIVIPTVYATVGKIQRSAYPAGKEAAPPTPDVVAQIQQAAANAEAMARAVREDAELGKFNGEQGEPGGWYTPEIRQPIKKSMVVNLIPSKEGMPAAEPKLILLPEGEAGGWYTPAITQPDANTMRVSFTPSNEDMPAVEPADITIPTGGGSGTSGADGGYYTPEVTQTSENTMQVAFSPSKTSMPAVSGTEITLPAGQKGDKGDTGATGADGKSAYAYAVEGGYTGTEAEFAAKLAEEYPDGIVEATGGTVTEGNLVVWDVDRSLVRDGGAVPTKLPNPNALTFTGAVTGSYDGSQPLTVEIPSGGGGDVDLSLYQEKQDNSLNPSDKTIVGAINEIDTISRKDFVLLVNDTLIADNAGLSSYEYELPVPVPVNRGIGILIQSPSSASAGYREIYNQNNKKIGKILNGSYTVRISLCEVKNGYYAVATHSSTNPAALVSNLSPGAVFFTPNSWDGTAYYDKADDSITKVKLNSCDAIMQEGTKIRIWMY